MILWVKFSALRRGFFIFTESRRTQDYLVRILSDSPWGDKLLLFNGSNTDQRSKAIYEAWAAKHGGTDKITGSKSADMRSAPVDYFWDEGMIMIATEAGAEGINLQFCSLVVNYDLPWNPQRIEQRIGRCHRYGQRHDVVVVNFLNEKNEADQRVYQLLSEKFRLFDGVFGSSDEVLGSIESGVDFEKRIADIYQHCRKNEDIQAAFDALQSEMSEDIDDSLQKARTELIENFDDEVREKLRVRSSSAQEYRNRFETLLMDLTRHELKDYAEFCSDYSFHLCRKTFDGDYPLGLYELPRRIGEAHLYRLGHPLAAAVINTAKNRELKPGIVEFDLTRHEGKIFVLEEYWGTTGKLSACILTVQALEQTEEYFLFAGITRDGKILDDEAVKRLFTLDGTLIAGTPEVADTDISALLDQKEQAVLYAVSQRNTNYFNNEAGKLDGWAEDLKLGLEREIKDLDKQIKETRRLSVASLTLEEKLKHQREIKALESSRNTKRKSLFEAQDDIDRRRDELIEAIDEKLEMEYNREVLFEIEWRLR
jgi:adenine-specific DNA-methyltransferase